MKTARMLRVEASQTTTAKARAATEERAATRRTAVLVCHGMGQQVPFETIDLVARQICELARPQDPQQTSGQESSPVQVEQVMASDGSWLPRAAISLTSTKGDSISVHFYEGYWAPITEGKVTLRDTLSFLFWAGWRGLKFSVRDGVFDRFMFGSRQEFTIPSRSIVELGLAFWTVALLSVMFVGWWVFALALAASILGVSWPGPDNLAGIISADLGLGLAVLVTGAIGFVVSRVFGGGSIESRQSLDVRKPSLWKRIPSLLAAVGVMTISAYLGYRFASWLSPSLPGRPRLFESLSVLCVLVGLGLYWARSFLIQFPGDVAAYVSSYKVSKFQQTRSEIQAACRRVASFIYELGYQVPGEPKRAAPEPPYDEVLIVGHSLGSVVCYDTLNDAINRDIHVNGWYEGSPLGRYRVLERTRLLLTFGSPLDKTAFIFRTQEDHERFEIREGLAATMQPLILADDYHDRPKPWINVWSRWDWVSGRLDFYDKPKEMAPPAVVNVQAKTSVLPGGAHTGYWDHSVVRGVIYTALTGDMPSDVRAGLVDATDADRICQALGGVCPPAGAGLAPGDRARTPAR